MGDIETATSKVETNFHIPQETILTGETCAAFIQTATEGKILLLQN